MIATEWQTSSKHLSAMVEQAQKHGFLERALSRCAPDIRLALENPNATQWHSGSVLTSLAQNILDDEGSTALENLYFELTKGFFGSFVTTAMQVAMVFSGVSPPTALAHFLRFMKLNTRFVEAQWALMSESGLLTVQYPNDINRRTSVAAWMGVFRFLGDLTNSKIAVDSVEFISPSEIHFHLSWKINWRK
jgi:hypothetical protein